MNKEEVKFSVEQIECLKEIMQDEVATLMKEEIQQNYIPRIMVEGMLEKLKEFIPHYTKGKREGQEVEENFLRMGQEQCKFIESIDYRILPYYPSDEEWEKKKNI